MATYLLAHLLAFALAGGTAVGDSGATTPADQLPQPATTVSPLDRAARDYRIQTYETFHKDRAEYDRRQAEGKLVQDSWTDAGRSDKEQPMLIDWLGQATAASRTDSIAELPPAPKFTPVPQKKEPEKKLVEATKADSVQDAAATVDDLLHVKPAGSTTAAEVPSPVPNAVPPSLPPSVPPSLPPSVPPSVPTTLVPPAEPAADAAANSDPAVQPAPTNPEPTATPVTPQSKSTTIGSLPKAFEEEINRTLHGLSGK
jgi:hypothetical protein